MKDQRITILADWLDKQKLDGTITDGTIWDKMGLSRTVFYRLKPKALVLQQERAEIRQKEVERVNVSAAREAAKNGLKSKTERVMLLQKQIDGIEEDLQAGILVDYVVIGGKVQKVNKEMNAETKAYLRKTIKDIQAEISKIEGDYAPEKRLNYNADLSQLSDEELQQELRKYGIS